MTVDHDRSHSRTYSRPHHDDNEPPPVEWNGIIGDGHGINTLYQILPNIGDFSYNGILAPNRGFRELPI